MRRATLMMTVLLAGAALASAQTAAGPPDDAKGRAGTQAGRNFVDDDGDGVCDNCTGAGPGAGQKLRDGSGQGVGPGAGGGKALGPQDGSRQGPQDGRGARVGNGNRTGNCDGTGPKGRGGRRGGGGRGGRGGGN